MGISTYAHSGRTDSSGGHKDNKNKSGLGSYHYHCGGYPAHLHTNGICPYSSKESSSSSTTTKAKTSTVAVSGIKINENIEDFMVGSKRTLTATITPNNAADKSITWKSSNEDIITINSGGEIIAKNFGVAEITAISSNGKTSTIRINVKEDKKSEDNNIMALNTNITKNNDINRNNATNTNNALINTINQDERSNPIGTIVALGALGGGGCWMYKKYKNSQ